MRPKSNYNKIRNYNYSNNNNSSYYNHNQHYNQNYQNYQNYSNNYNQNNNQNYNQINQPNKINQNMWPKLNFVKRLEDHNQTINNLIALNELNYLTTDNDKLCIRKIGDYINNYKEEFKNTEILKVIFSSGKLVVSLENLLGTSEKNINEINTIERKVSYEIKIGILNNSKIQYFSRLTNNKPIDIFESDNRIVLAGNNIIELFQFNNNQLSKISEIKLRNDNTDNNMKNILCIERINDALICGHASGHISIWKPINEYPFLKNTSISRIHLGPINKIIYDKASNNIDVIISCSSDKTVKVHSIRDTICFSVLNFKSEAIDIKKVKDLNNNIYYIVSLKNGQLKIYDDSFKKVFGTKKLGINSPRYVINVINSNNNIMNSLNINNDNNNYIIITEGNKIDIYKWKKESSSFSFSSNDNNNKNNKNDKNKKRIKKKKRE